MSTQFFTYFQSRCAHPARQCRPWADWSGPVRTVRGIDTGARGEPVASSFLADTSLLANTSNPIIL
jgi:hypothetical protein